MEQLKIGTDYYIELINNPELSPQYSKKARGIKFRGLVPFEGIPDSYEYPKTQILDLLDYPGSMLATFESVESIPEQQGECYPCREKYFGEYNGRQGGYKFYDTSIYDERTHGAYVDAMVGQVANNKLPVAATDISDIIAHFVGGGVRKSRRQTRKRQTRKRQTRKRQTRKRQTRKRQTRKSLD